MGAAYGTAKSGIGISGVATFRPDLIMKVSLSSIPLALMIARGRDLVLTKPLARSPPQCLIPVVMSGIIAVYALVIAVLIAQDLQPPEMGSYSLFKFVPATPNDSIPRPRYILIRKG